MDSGVVGLRACGILISMQGDGEFIYEWFKKTVGPASGANGIRIRLRGSFGV